MTTWCFKRYCRPDDVGWLGWIEVLGEVIAYVDLHRRIVFSSETECDDSDPTDNDDPADWWKNNT